MKTNLYRPNNWQKDFLELLKKAILLAGSRSALSRVIGVHYTTISDWQRGAIPNDENIRRIDEFVALNGRNEESENVH